jgi:signal peptidase I
MSKRKTPEARKSRPVRPPARGTETDVPPSSGLGRTAARAAASPAGDDSNWLSSAAVRETIESVIIAFVLAFLFRTFEAEAFVIPTGSMAPTLMGKHKDIECPVCHYRYQANASDDQQDNRPAAVSTTTCPMCRYTANVAPGNPQHEKYESYEGDRILVAKFPYEFADPQRWDVVVFKYPGNSVQNYIKRLVGRPGETIRIHDGDLWIHRPGDDKGQFEVARKPPAKILAMLQPVYDNDLAPIISGKLGMPARWEPDPAENDFAWKEHDKDASRFATEGSGKGAAWIRYRHRVPTSSQWKEALLAAGKAANDMRDREKWLDLLRPHMPAAKEVKPQLISDFTAYDTSIIDGKPLCANGLHWVGDLAVQFELESQAASGEVIAELVKAGRRFQCRIDLAKGKAEMSIDGGGAEAEKFHPVAATPLAGGKRHTITFSNVDDQLRLWVDGGLVKFGDDRGTENDTATAFDSAKLHGQMPATDGLLSIQAWARLHDQIPTDADLNPVSIGAAGAAVEVRHIKVLRDVYYIADSRQNLSARTPVDYPRTPFGQQPPLTDFIQWFPSLTDSDRWSKDFASDNMWTVEVSLDAPNSADPAKDRFFVLGDNSAQSQDGRLWAEDPNWRGGPQQYWVDRELFIGKALFIYWPHGWKDYLPFLPFNPEPNFARMHLVR